MTKKNYITILTIITLGIATLCSYFPSVCFAKSCEFDNTSALQDLQQTDNFNIFDYTFDIKKDLELVNFVEYCYGTKDYGLYVYIYNPQNLTILDNKQNKIQLAANSSNYNKYNIKLLNNYKNKFLKYKVENVNKFAKQLDRKQRIYKISGVELFVKNGKYNATDFKANQTYTYTGFAKGTNKNNESTLKCNVKGLETIKLDVYHTNYRTGLSDKGKNYYNDLQSIYFSIPDKYLNNYGNLVELKAEWWEYKTKPILITESNQVYNAFSPYIGRTLNEGGTLWSRLLDKDVHFQCYTLNGYDFGYNTTLNDAQFKNKCSNIPYLFSTNGVKAANYTLKNKDLANYIYNYKSKYNNDYINCNGRKISKDLFENKVDSGRQIDYNNKTIKFGDTFDMNSYNTSHDWWQKLTDYGLGIPTDLGEDYKDINPIKMVEPKNLAGNISKNLLINKNDVDEFSKFCVKEKAKNRTPHICRFGVTDYYTTPVATANGNWINDVKCNQSYIAQETAFLDFDVISLTFKKNEKLTVIPTVANPIDIFNDVTPPPKHLSWLLIVLIIIAILLACIILLPILYYVFKILWWIISLPYKIVKNIKGDKEKQ